MTQNIRKRAQARAASAETIKLRLSPVAFAVMAVMASGGAVAQEQTVTVTGIRASIENSINVKKSSDSIVEAISAEDIGKLPDNSIAESIARMPGLTAQRNRDTGRAQEVSIRGMPSSFGTALLNGREQSTTGFDRGVEFDQYPSELMNSVVVYKTTSANLAGQGLAGTVDLRTIDPLARSGRSIVVNARREKTGVGLDETGSANRTSLSYVDQFMDRKLGVALGFAKFDGRTGGLTSFDSWGAGQESVGGVSVKVPHTGFNEFTEVNSFERDGVVAILSYKPSADFSSKLDLFYSKFLTVVDRVGFGGPLADGLWGERAPFDRQGSLINAKIEGDKAVSGTWTQVRGFARNDPQQSNDKLTSIGWNTEFRVSPSVRGEVDLSRSTAKRDWMKFDSTATTVGPVLPTGPTNLTNVSYTGFGSQYSTSLDFSDPKTIKLTDPQGWGGSQPQAGYLNNPQIDETTKSIKIKGTWDLPDNDYATALDFGVNWSDRSKVKVHESFYLAIKGAGSNKFAWVDVPNPSVAYAGASKIPVIKWDMFSQYEQVYDLIPNLRGFEVNKNWRVDEKVVAPFAKLDLDTKLFGVKVRGNLGLQIQNVDQSSTAKAVDTTNGDPLVPPQSLLTEGKSYSDVLPSANLIFDLSQAELLRVSLGRQVARPNMESMRAVRQYSIDVTKQTYSGSGGNPKLDPFVANAADVSYERYFGTKAYFGVAAFYKDLESYVVDYTDGNFDFRPYLQPGTVIFPKTIGQFTAPTNGEGGAIRGVELTGSFPLDMFLTSMAGFGVVATYSNTSSSVTPPNRAGGSSASMPLPGLSKRVSSLTAYYERNGYQFRVAQRARSAFVGSLIDVYAQRSLKFIAPERLVDAQVGYEFGQGALKGLSILLQANNLTDAEFKQYENTPENVTYRAKFGRSYILGVNYKF